MSHANPVLQGVKRTDSFYFACGGKSDLFRAQWTRKSGEISPVAIKQIRRSSWNDKSQVEQSRKRFMREAELWAKLYHPNIVPFYGLVFERDFPGLVMPYYQNGDLIEFLVKHPESNRLDLICQAAKGLEYLHNVQPHPIVHGDVKAGNIMITDDGKACLADFGVAKMLSVSGYTTTSVGGTCRWMSPEILEDYDPSPTVHSDMWALAMTVLQVHTGKVPFDHLKNDATVIVGLVRGILPQQPPEINDALWMALNRCWVKEPTKRPATATLSIVLNLFASQSLTPDLVNSLIGYLESGGQWHRDEGVICSSPVEHACPHNFVDSKQPLATLRRLSWQDSSTDSSKNSSRKPSEPPPKFIKEACAYPCRWPACGFTFDDLALWQADQVSHWVTWRSKNDC